VKLRDVGGAIGASRSGGSIFVTPMHFIFSLAGIGRMTDCTYDAKAGNGMEMGRGERSGVCGGGGMDGNQSVRLMRGWR